MDVNGSPEFALTWRPLDMPAGPPICQLAASARRTGGSGSTGALCHWQTPKATEGMGTYGITNGKRYEKLCGEARGYAAWATPRARDHKGDGVSIARRREGWLGDSVDYQAKHFGQAPSGASGPTEKRGALDARFVAFLMGFPPAWVRAGMKAQKRRK